MSIRKLSIIYSQANEPGAYGRISNLRTWIDTTLSGATYCPNGGADAASSRLRKNKSLPAIILPGNEKEFPFVVTPSHLTTPS